MYNVYDETVREGAGTWEDKRTFITLFHETLPCSHTKTLLLMKYPGKKPINDYSHFLAYTCSRAQTHVTAHTSDTAYYIAHTSFCTCT